MEHINRMKDELKELKERIKKEIDFLSSEKSKTLIDQTQRTQLQDQIAPMREYHDILLVRIEYNTKLAKINGTYKEEPEEKTDTSEDIGTEE